MKRVFIKPLSSYVVGTFIIVLLTGSILSYIVTDYLVLILVLGIQYIVLVIMLLLIYDKYIKPIEIVSQTVTKLVEGNFQARAHLRTNGSIGILSSKVNKLARNLSELSTHEQMQAEQFSTVIDNTESGLVLIDEKGYIHLVNRKFISMFGGTTKDYIGYLYYEALDNVKIHETVQKTFLYEGHVKDSFIHIKEAERSYLEIVGAPIFDEKGMLKGAVLVLYDITEFKKLELMRKDFVANVSHELKTPITSIRGFSETLLDGAMEDKETNEKFLAIIHEESKRLQLLIEDLLILSRLEQEAFTLAVSKVDINVFLEEIIPMIKQQAENNGVVFTTVFDKTLTLLADGEKLKQVFINVLSNAISYTPKYGEVLLQIDQVADQLCIQVKDTGIGMEQAVLSRIFERFYRVDKARSRNTGGTGLGLAIAKHIVEAHGGSITVESELNKGTTFTIYIPSNI